MRNSIRNKALSNPHVISLGPPLSLKSDSPIQPADASCSPSPLQMFSKLFCYLLNTYSGGGLLTRPWINTALPSIFVQFAFPGVFVTGILAPHQ